MSNIFFNSIISALCCSFMALVVAAQPSEPYRQNLSLVKIERFDWYAAREAAEPTMIKNYRRGQPEGKSSNFPPQNSLPFNESEKFIYRIRIRNLSEKEIESVVWRYEFVNPLTKQLEASLEFYSVMRIKPHQRKTIYAESFSPPSRTVDVNLLLLNKKQPFLESATIKSLVFANTDGGNAMRLTFNTAADQAIDWRFIAQTDIGQNINIALSNNINITFSNVTAEGVTTATALTLDQQSPLPFNFSLIGSSVMYEISTTAFFSGNVVVSFCQYGSIIGNGQNPNPKSA